MHAKIIVGDSVIMAGEPIVKYGIFPASIFIYVSGFDNIYEKAIAFRGTSLMTPYTLITVYSGVEISV